MNKTIDKLRTKLANLIRPKRKYTTKIGRGSFLSITEGSDKINFSLFNNSVRISTNIKDFIKAYK